MTLKEMTSLIRICAGKRWALTNEEEDQIIAALKAGQAMRDTIQDLDDNTTLLDGTTIQIAANAWDTVFKEDV